MERWTVVLDALPIFAIFFAIRYLASEAQYQRAKRKDNVWYFPAGIALRLIHGLGIPLLVYTSYRVYTLPDESGGWFLPVILIFTCAAGVIGFPSTITIDDNGIHQVRVLGFGRKTIYWKGARVGYSSTGREALVVGSNGTTILHTQYHVGQRQFIALLTHRGVFIQESP
mgnify:CR=1 FL=1